MSQYVVVDAESMTELGVKVVDLMRNNWMPQGGVAVVDRVSIDEEGDKCGVHLHFYQAMVTKPFKI